MVSASPIQASMRRPDLKSLVSFFSSSLGSFQSSSDGFRVLCTLPHAENSPDPAPRRPARPVSNLVVLDSSFNPPTRAHAGMAREALDAAASAGGSRRLLLLLSVNNADKAPKPASFPVRLGMMDAMGRQLLQEMGKDGARDDDGNGLEIDLAVTTMPFFHDKARAIAQSGFYSSSSPPSPAPGPTQTFLAGFDTLVRIFNPKYYGAPNAGDTPKATPMQRALRPFFAEARLRVTTRPDEQWGGTEAQRAEVEQLAEGRLAAVGGDGKWAERVDVVEGGPEGEGVSSSQVRDLVKAGATGDEVDGLVGSEVSVWIENGELYGDKDAAAAAAAAALLSMRDV